MGSAYLRLGSRLLGFAAESRCAPLCPAPVMSVTVPSGATSESRTNQSASGALDETCRQTFRHRSGIVNEAVGVNRPLVGGEIAPPEASFAADRRNIFQLVPADGQCRRR